MHHFISLKINGHLPLLLSSYTIWYNNNYSVITEVDVMIKAENDSDDTQECCLTQHGQISSFLGCYIIFCKGIHSLKKGTKMYFSTYSYLLPPKDVFIVNSTNEDSWKSCLKEGCNMVKEEPNTLNVCSMLSSSQNHGNQVRGCLYLTIHCRKVGLTGVFSS